jgi:hypothetical protein
MNEEHAGLRDLSQHVEDYSTMRFDDQPVHNQVKNLTGKAMGHIFDSQDHHDAGRYKEAYAGLTAAARAIGTASKLVPKYGNDNFLGLSMHPAGLAEAHLISYRNAFFS